MLRYDEILKEIRGNSTKKRKFSKTFGWTTTKIWAILN